MTSCMRKKLHKLVKTGGKSRCKEGKMGHRGRPGLTNKRAGTTGRGRLGAKCSNKSSRSKK